MPVLPYQLSQPAEQDVIDIFDYTAVHFGAAQAITYVQSIDAALATLGTHPEMGRARPDIRDGLRSLALHRHVLFYRLLPDHIRVIRILSAHRDVQKISDLVDL